MAAGMRDTHYTPYRPALNWSKLTPSSTDPITGRLCRAPPSMKLSYLPLAALLAFLGTQPALGQTILGTASSYAVLGASTVTNTGSTVVNGDLGVSPGTAVTGFPPGTLSGVFRTIGESAAAQTDALAAYNTVKLESFSSNQTGQDLGGLTLTAGVYSFSSSAQLTGTLILDAQGNANARFDFQVGSTFTTASASGVQLINGANAANIYWDVGSSATFGTNSHIVGTVLAVASITANTGASFDGRLIALNAAVTLDSNTISVPASVPEPATSGLIAGLAIGCLMLVRKVRHRQG